MAGYENIFSEAEEKMLGALEVLERDLRGIRTGQASPALLEPLRVEVYGTTLAVRDIAQVVKQDAKLLVIRPYDTNNLGAIEKAILNSGLSLAPQNDGKIIRLTFPELTEETRQKSVAQVRKRGEETKTAIRNVRRDANKALEKLQKEKKITEDERDAGKEKIQKITDEHTALVDELVEKKGEELLER